MTQPSLVKTATWKAGRTVFRPAAGVALLFLAGQLLQAGPMLGPWTYASCDFVYSFGTDSQACTHPLGMGGASATVTNWEAGEVHLGAQIGITLLNHSGPYNMGAAAALGDMVTFYGPLPQYQVELVFLVSGSLFQSGALPLPYTTFQWQPYGVGMGGKSWDSPFWQAGYHTYSLETGKWGFATETPYNWIYRFGVVSQGNGAGLSGSAAADFSGSAELIGGIVTDMEGNPVSGVRYTTASGNALPLEGAVFLPEPGTALLLPAGLLLLVALRKRRAPGR